MSLFLLHLLLLQDWCRASQFPVYPRCRTLTKPTMNDPCTIQGQLFTIQSKVNSNTSYDEYLAIIRKNESFVIPVILQWFPINNLTLIRDYISINEIHLGIKARYNISNLDPLHLVNVYSNYGIASHDKSAIIILKWYPNGNLRQFARKRSYLAKHLRNYYQEVFACHSWCDFLRQIAIPLNKFNFARVELQDIFIDDNEIYGDHYQYVLGRLERQNTEQHDHLILSALTMAAWRYYSMLSVNDFIVNGNGKHLYWGTGVNHFAKQSKEYWSTHITDSGDMEDRRIESGSDAEIAMMTSILPGAQSGGSWKDSMEYYIACFTSEFASGYTQSQKQQTWRKFDEQWHKICYDWIYEDWTDKTLNARDKWDAISSKISNSDISRSEIPSSQHDESRSSKSLFSKLQDYRYQMTQGSKPTDTSRSEKTVTFDFNEDIATVVLDNNASTNSDESDSSNPLDTNDGVDVTEANEFAGSLLERPNIGGAVKSNVPSKKAPKKKRISGKLKKTQKWYFKS